MLGHTLRKMHAAGICNVVVNVHAFADKVENYLQGFSAANPEMSIRVSDERALLLETGGGLKKMKPLLADDAFIVPQLWMCFLALICWRCRRLI